MLVNSPNDIPTWLSGWFAALNQGQSRVTSIQSAEIKGNTCKWRHHVPANMLWSMSRLRTWHPGHCRDRTSWSEHDYWFEKEFDGTQKKTVKALEEPCRNCKWTDCASWMDLTRKHISRPIKRMLYSLQKRRLLFMFWLNCDYVTCHRFRDKTKVKFK